MRELHINGMTPPALSIAIALREKKLPFDLVEVDWRQTITAMAAFSDSIELVNSLEAEFPILVDEGAAIGDSFFVLEYLDDRYPDPPLKPADAYGAWRVQSWARFLGERAAPAVATIGTDAFLADEPATDLPGRFASAEVLTLERRDAWARALSGPADPAVVAESERKISLLLDRVEAALEAGPWLLGPSYTITDIAAFSMIHGLREVAGGLDLSSCPRTAEWLERVAGRPAVNAAISGHDIAVLPGAEHARWG